jgi:organic radical activating enzyme
MYLALQQIIEHLDYISMDMKLPSTSGCTEHLWDLHRLFLHTAHARNVSVKIVVGKETDGKEICQVCDIIASVDRDIPLFIQPVTLPGGKIGIDSGHILRLQELAACLLPDVRVIPQMHKLLGAL